MGYYQQFNKNKSLFFVAKSFAAFQIILFLGCVSTKSQLETVPIDITPITSLGQNDEGTFSNKGKEILFVSWQRTFHKNTQIYWMDLDSLKERRLTFQDGLVSNPLFTASDQNYVYLSTTDEIKETPEWARSKSTKPSFEIYQSDLWGENIKRITNKPGFDGNLKWIGRTLLQYESEQNGQFIPFSYELITGNRATLKNASPETLPQLTVQTLEKVWKIVWVVNKMGCEITLHSSNKPIWNPQLSKNKEQLLWTSEINSAKQLFLKTLPEEWEKCPMSLITPDTKAL